MYSISSEELGHLIAILAFYADINNHLDEPDGSPSRVHIDLGEKAGKALDMIKRISQQQDAKPTGVDRDDKEASHIAVWMQAPVMVDKDGNLGCDFSQAVMYNAYTNGKVEMKYSAFAVIDRKAFETELRLVVGAGLKTLQGTKSVVPLTSLTVAPQPVKLATYPAVDTSASSPASSWCYDTYGTNNTYPLSLSPIFTNFQPPNLYYFHCYPFAGVKATVGISAKQLKDMVVEPEGAAG